MVTVGFSGKSKVTRRSIIGQVGSSAYSSLDGATVGINDGRHTDSRPPPSLLSFLRPSRSSAHYQ